MKKIMLALLMLFSFSANAEVVYENHFAKVEKLCIDGYMYLLVIKFASQAGVAIVQMMESGSVMLPVKCKK